MRSYDARGMWYDSGVAGAVVVASGNAGKIAEIRAALAHLPLALSCQADWGVAGGEEPHRTFVENALEKARHVARQIADTSKQAPFVLADDSGLIVPALDNAPGLYSARYAGDDRDDDKNNKKLLAAMDGVEQRAAAYYAVLVLIKNESDPQPIIAEGIWRGVVVREPMGEDGFGYDPLFYDEQLQKTAAQMSMEEKNAVSHRGQSLRRLVAALEHALPAWQK